ncbi:MAG: hypothetical protein LWX07_02755 [Bacteroidetes bacterium]|nr:hypothetical protein [Bacteroidota bacterium]
MYIIPDIVQLKLNKNFDIAYSILQDILALKCPDIRKIETLYGSQKSHVIRELMKDFIGRYLDGAKRIRPHNPDSPMEITLARKAVEKNPDYQKVHSSILLNKIPEIRHLEIFYGEYSKSVQDVIRLYVNLNLKRKCEIGAASHLNRVGAVVFQLRMNNPGAHDYSAAAMLHDSIEDLVKLKRKPDGRLDTDSYNSFIEKYIPEQLQAAVKILTNHYNIILSYILDILEEEDKAYTLKNILGELEKIAALKYRELSGYAEKMHKIFRKAETEGNLIEALRWECYKNLYLEGISKETSSRKDHRVYEIKGVDLSDNSHGKGSLSIDARIRNINKNLMWGVKGYSMESTWKPFNAHIQEVMEDAYQSAEYLILSDLLQPHSSADFVMSALLKILKMEDVFYI